MSILHLIIAVFAIALAFWANNTYIAPGIVRKVVNVILIIICLVLVLNVTGLINIVNMKV